MEEMVQRGFDDFAPQIVNASEPHMACLFLLDTSGSMQGEPIDELVSALNRFKIEVCEDKTTRDVLDVAIVEFNSTVNVVQEFVPIEYMEPVSLMARGGTDMNGGLRTAIDIIIERGRFYRRSGTQPYCPWIVMITDGYPNDSIDNVAEEILSLDQQDKLRLWSLAVKGADTKLLNKLGHGKRVLELEGYDFSKFFDWVNKSMRSISVSSPGEKARGQELPDNVNKAIDDVGDIIIWQPDKSLPYVIHSEDSQFFDGMVIIEPAVLYCGTFPHRQFNFEFWTNRNHGFVGQLLQHDANEAYFKLAEDQFEGPAILRIAVMTDDEFKLEQAKHSNLAIKSKEELVRLYIDDLD